MRKSRFTEEQIIAILQEQEAGRRRRTSAASTASARRRPTLRRYREEGLKVRRCGGRKRALGTRAPAALPQAPDQHWSLDFVSDALTDGRQFRILAVVDDFSREYLCLVADTSLSCVRLTR